MVIKALGKRVKFKTIYFKTVLILMVLVLSLLPTVDSQSKSAMSSITVIVPEQCPPYYLLDNKGRPQGLAIDVISAIANKEGHSIRYLIMHDWPMAYETLKNSPVPAIIPAAVISQNYTEFLDYTQSLERSYLELFVHSDNKEVQSISDLSGKNVGVVRENIGYITLRMNAEITIIPYDTFEHALFSLISGQIDGLVYHDDVANYLIKTKIKAQLVKKIPQHVADIHVAMAVNKGDADLVSKLDMALSEMVNNGDYEKIHKAWLHSDKGLSNGHLYARVLLVFIALIVLGLAIWRYVVFLTYKNKLEDTVDERTKELKDIIQKQSETKKRLRQREQLLRSHIENTPLAAITWDLQFRCTDWNKSAERIFGYSKQEALGKHASELIVPEQAQAHVDIVFDSLLKQNGGKHSVNENITKNGGSVLCEWFNTVLVDERGKVFAVSSLVQDVTEQNRAQEKIQSLLAYNKTVIDSSPIGIAIFDQEGKFKLANYSFEEIIERINQPGLCLDIKAGSLWDKYDLLVSIDKSLKTSTRERLEVQAENKQGEKYYVDCIFVPLTLEDEQHLLVMLDDISQRRYIEEALSESQRYYNVAETIAHLGSWNWDIKNSSVTWTDEEYRMFGYEPGVFEPSFELYLEHVHPDDLEFVTNNFKGVLNGRNDKIDIEHRIIRHDGKTRIIHAQGILYRDNMGQPTNMLGISHDITERKQVELDLLEARDEAEKANMAKSEFLANMSHELRTPLHGILSYAQFGIDKYQTLAPEKILKYFNQISSSGYRLKVLLDDLLDLSKLESGKMSIEFKSIDISPIINSCIAEQKALLQQRQLHINIDMADDLPSCYCDETRIGQIIMNILSNAIKFSPVGGNIYIKVFADSMEQEKNGTINSMHFIFTDQGPGIPVGEEENIFNKFIQSSITKKSAGGTGLGLAITKELVMAHNGRVWCRNADVGGAEFHILIPIKANQKAA